MKCKTRGCKRRAVVVDWCRSHAKKVADKRFSKETRALGMCMGKVKWLGPEFECKGPLQCAHIVSRRYLAVRWEDDNSLPLCAAHHMWLDTHPLEKDKQAIKWLGEDRFEELKNKAMAGDWKERLEEYLK